MLFTKRINDIKWYWRSRESISPQSRCQWHHSRTCEYLCKIKTLCKNTLVHWITWPDELESRKKLGPKILWHGLFNDTYIAWWRRHYLWDMFSVVRWLDFFYKSPCRGARWGCVSHYQKYDYSIQQFHYEASSLASQIPKQRNVGGTLQKSQAEINQCAHFQMPSAKTVIDWEYKFWRS